MNKTRLLALLSLCSLAFAGCGAEDSDPAPKNDPVAGENSEYEDTNTGKTDTPEDSGTVEELCELRKQDALQSAQKTFTRDAIRWACADVEGVNTVGGDSRGQEYCEYFVLVQPPPEEEGGELPSPVDLGRFLDDGGVTPLGIELTEDQQFWLEDYGDEVVGQCIFTSWHTDIGPKLEKCEDDDCGNLDILGFPLRAEYFRMKVGFNSNMAAADLVRECLENRTPIGNPDVSEDPLHSDFFRACMQTGELYGTHWRRSDPAVCAAAVRLKECGCSLPDNADVPTSLVPTQPQLDDEGNEVLTLRGFPLGTWSGVDELPMGCQHVEVGEDGQNIVACELTANDLLENANDPKERCRTKYGNNVVVHVPIPADLISCNPPENGFYSETCNDVPWVVEQ